MGGKCTGGRGKKGGNTGSKMAGEIGESFATLRNILYTKKRSILFRLECILLQSRYFP